MTMLQDVRIPLYQDFSNQPFGLKSKILRSILPPGSHLAKQVVRIASKLEAMSWEHQLKNDGIPKVNQIFTYTTRRELRTLYDITLSCKEGAKALEIGSYLGASSSYIAAALSKKNGHLYCIDTWNNETMIEGQQDTFAVFRSNTDGVKQYITQVRKRSEDVSSQEIATPLNLVFIDGDHSYDAVKKDFDLVQPWLSEDAIIAFHDVGNLDYEGVTRFIGEVLATGDWMLVGYVDTLAWIKRAKWNKPAWV
jgi:predicted O-methyltransferase YrrM